ncbi:MAG TPA: branched-chain amino acid ABC transporter permease [Dissulfurispiraceae bacterium]|nr:branched-chain amino acid ABC transporter permease [Dissulfurispiraceae bacterium]
MTRGHFIALALLAACALLLPLATDDSYILSLMIFSGINAIVAIGLCILMGSAGQVSLGQAGFYGIGAYASAILSQLFGLPVVAAICGAAVLSAAAAVILAVPSLRLKGHYLAVATLGFGEIVYIFLNEFGPGGPSGFGDIPPFSAFGVVITESRHFAWLVWSVLILLIIFSLNMLNARPGRALRALHGSETASSAVGLDVVALKIKVFVLSAIYASIAGSLYAHYVSFISPSSFALFYSVLLLMMVVLGGITTVWGGVVGAVLITLLPEPLKAFEELDVLVYGMILTLSLLFLRRGIVPMITERFSSYRENRSA